MAEGSYVTYRASRPPVAFSFLYPADWRVREIAEDGSRETYIAGPASHGGAYTVSLAVRVSDSELETPGDAAEDFGSRYRAAPGFRELGRASGTVAGRPAVELEIAYRIPLPVDSARAQPTVIRERHIFLKRGAQLYELLYAAPEEDYERWLAALRTLVQTFGFEPGRSDSAFRPLVAVPVPQGLREEAGEYGNQGSQQNGGSEQGCG